MSFAMEIDQPISINVATEFSDAPGARYTSDGPKSGEEFYRDFLLPRFQEALQRPTKLVIILDGVWGFASSFLSESFGELSKEFGPEVVLENMELVSEEEPMLIEYITRIVRNPERQQYAK